MTQRIVFFNSKLSSSIRNAELRELQSFAYRALEVNCTNDVQHIEEANKINTTRSAPALASALLSCGYKLSSGEFPGEY